MITSPLGIDVSKLKFDACLIRESGKFRHKVFPNSPAGFSQLSAWLIKHHVARAHACLEATGSYGEALTEYLHGAGHVVSVVNPAAVKAYGQSRTLAYQDRQGRLNPHRAVLRGALPRRMAAVTRRNTGVAGTCPPPRCARGDAADGG